MSKQSKKVRAFLKEIVFLYDKHGLALSHEDEQGAFLVVPYSPEEEDTRP